MEQALQEIISCMRETLHKVDANDSNDDDKRKAENIRQKALEMFV